MRRNPLLAVALLLALAGAGRGQDVNSLLARIKAVGKEGNGNVEAAEAWKELVRQGPAVLPDVLAGMDDASPVATNWLRAAVETIADDAGKKLPADKIEAFVRDTAHAGRPRRLAYELLVRVDPKAPDRLLPGMLDDPGAELRRDAVAVLIKDAQQLLDAKDAKAKDAFQKVLRQARDRDQVDLAAARLKKLGVEIDLTAHYGFVTSWLVAGPFDNAKGVGFEAVYPPDKGVDPKAVYAGKDKKEVRWQEYITKEKLGLVDFNKALASEKGVVGYAWAVVESTAERPVELRAASNNAVRIYLNGQEVYSREEYHHGMELDQHVGKGTLKAGRNEILVKVCQNEQTEDWARLWSFQLRVCDSLGAAVPFVATTKAASGGAE